MKAVDYLNREYSYNLVDMEIMYGDDWLNIWRRLEVNGLNDPKTKSDEKNMMTILDDFFLDYVQNNRRRRRAY